jgi:hypothetical protein
MAGTLSTSNIGSVSHPAETGLLIPSGNGVLVQVESDAKVAGYLSALANTQELTLSRTPTIALRFLRSGAVGPIVSHWSGFSGTVKHLSLKFKLRGR